MNNAQSLDASIAAAKRLIGDNALAQAARLLRAVARKAPANAEARFELGKACFMRGDHKDAEKYFRQALARDASHLYARVLLAKTCFARGEREKAAAETRTLLGIKTADALAKHDIAGLAASLGLLAGGVPAKDRRLANRALNERERSAKKLVLASKPRNLEVVLTNACNIRCTMCYIQKEKPWQLSEKTKDEILALLPTAETVLWQGGEAFYYKHFNELIAAAARAGVSQALITNGLLLTRPLIEKLARYGVKLTISIDGTDKATYERIRKGASFERLTKNLRLITAIRAETGRALHTQLEATIMKSNYRRVPDFVRFAARYKFDALRLHKIDCVEKNPENIFDGRHPKEMRFLAAARPVAEKEAKKRALALEWLLPAVRAAAKRKAVPGELLCDVPWHSLFIGYGGYTKPQCMCLKNAGNIMQESVEKLWNNTHMQEYRKKMAAGETAGICEENCLYYKMKQQKAMQNGKCKVQIAES